MPVAGHALLRAEIKKIDYALLLRILRGIMFAIIISTIMLSPFSMSGYYWPGV